MGFHSQAFNFPNCSSKGLNLPFAFFASDLHLREIEKKCSPSSLPPWRKEKKGRQEELLWAAAALGLFPRTQPPFGFLPAISLGWLEKLCQLQGLPHPWGMGETECSNRQDQSQRLIYPKDQFPGSVLMVK